MKELLALSGSVQGVEMMKGQFSAFQMGAVQEALKGHAITPGIHKILQENAEQASALIAAAISWENVEPTFVAVYCANLTQEEVDGINAFYKTPAGKAMVQKMPALMQQSSMQLQQSLGGMINSLKQLQQETILKLQAEFVK